MQDNYESVQRGFRVLVGSMSSFIGQTLNKVYKDKWWDMVLYALNDQKDLSHKGNYGELLDSLDVANCLRVITRMWRDVFAGYLPRNCLTWANELMGVRNQVSHAGQRDLEQPMAERALNTMVLLCAEIDKDGKEEINKLYLEVRARAEDMAELKKTYQEDEKQMGGSTQDPMEKTRDSEKHLDNKKLKPVLSLQEKLKSEGFYLIDNVTASDILWVIYIKEKEERFGEIVSLYNVPYAFEKRGALATKGIPAWRVMYRKKK